jgi:hypothetical protein
VAVGSRLRTSILPLAVPSFRRRQLVGNQGISRERVDGAHQRIERLLLKNSANRCSDPMNANHIPAVGSRKSPCPTSVGCSPDAGNAARIRVRGGGKVNLDGLQGRDGRHHGLLEPQAGHMVSRTRSRPCVAHIQPDGWITNLLSGRHVRPDPGSLSPTCLLPWRSDRLRSPGVRHRTERLASWTEPQISSGEYQSGWLEARRSTATSAVGTVVVLQATSRTIQMAKDAI